MRAAGIRNTSCGKALRIGEESRVARILMFVSIRVVAV